MNKLRKKIVYYYIIITIVLLIAEWNLFHLFEDHLAALIARFGISGELATACGILAMMLLFFAVSVLYYRKINQCVADEAQRQIRERSLLFANISHDLKNPMSSVIGFARALENGKVEAEDIPAVYHSICEKSLQMNGIIQKMFQFAKMESEGYALHKEPIELCGMLRAVVAEHYPEIEAHGIQLQAEIPESEIRICADRTELTRALDNLITNVIRHNPEGVGMLVSVKAADRRIRITVADTGIALPADSSETLFQPFYVSDASRQLKDGSGLGLAISRRIAELHGGRLYLDAQISGYTKGFVLELRDDGSSGS